MVYLGVQEGCSIRLLNPQTFSPGVWKLTSMLQEHFQSFVGANVLVKLSPPLYTSCELCLPQLPDSSRDAGVCTSF